jgi:hypothetical protein
MLAGHNVPGYYVLDAPGEENYAVAYCNFPVGPSGGQFQINTQVQLAAHSEPVGLTFYKI